VHSLFHIVIIAHIILENLIQKKSLKINQIILFFNEISSLLLFSNKFTNVAAKNDENVIHIY